MNARIWRGDLWRRPLLGLIAAALFAGGCARIPPARMLPETIRSVYVPLAINRSFEPGLEETLTRALQQRLLQDGQLRVTRRDSADAVLRVELKNYKPETGSLDDDRFARQTLLTLAANVYLYDPDDYRPGVAEQPAPPIFSWSNIPLIFRYSSDTRLTASTLEVDARRQALERLAQTLVDKIVYGAPDDADDFAAARAGGRRQPQPRLPVDALP